MDYLFSHRRYRLPFRIPMRTSHGAWRVREGILVRLTDAAGRVGYGEAAPIPWIGSETVDGIEAICSDLGDRLSDETIEAVPRSHATLRNALLSARAQATPLPTATEPRAVAALLPAGPAALRALPSKIDAGFRTFKWKVGLADFREELPLFDDLCGLLPEGAKVRLDANGAWDRRQAERWLERCAERPVEFLEDPCGAGIHAGESERRRAEDLLGGLAREFPTPLALDEPIAGDADLTHWLRGGWPGIFVVKPALLADASDALAALAHAKAEVVFSSALETSIGAGAALRHAFAWAGPKRALGFGVWPLFVDARCDGPYAVPFLRPEDAERFDAAVVWNAVNENRTEGGQP